jgi:hypothetical protein
LTPDAWRQRVSGQHHGLVLSHTHRAVAALVAVSKIIAAVHVLPLKFCHTLKTVYGNNHTGAVTNKHSVITMSHTMFARPATASKNDSFI